MCILFPHLQSDCHKFVFKGINCCPKAQFAFETWSAVNGLRMAGNIWMSEIVSLQVKY